MVSKIDLREVLTSMYQVSRLDTNIRRSPDLHREPAKETATSSDFLLEVAFLTTLFKSYFNSEGCVANEEYALLKNLKFHVI
ncbi:MAG: hypothetical protein AAF960_23370 [Bacteroidota bacterium]